ncbi:hypothetical protein Tco_0086139 [Tanacetum coccineum]
MDTPYLMELDTPYSIVDQNSTTAKSRTVNNISYIDATVAGKPVTISEASIRSDLLFDDADGIDSLNNQAIFDNLTLMEDEGEALERPSDSQPIPSPAHPNEDQLRTQNGLLLTSLKKKGDKEYVSKQRRKSVKSSKGEPSIHKDPAFDDLDDDAMDYMETKDAQDEGRTSFVNKQKEKEKGVEIRNVEDTERPRPTSTRYVLTLKPLPKIDPKDKVKKMLMKKRKVQEEWEAEEEKKRLAEEEATKVALTNEYDFIQARINADKILAEELQKEEREKFTIKQRAKFYHDSIVAKGNFIAHTKHVGGKKHSDLKTKTFEEIQVLYERLKRQDQNFVAIGSAKDERQIKELNKDPKKKRVIKETPRKEDTAKIPIEQTVTEARDLKIMMESLTEENDQGDFWNNQQEWEIVRWRLYEACGVFILELKETGVIYMLVERRHKNWLVHKQTACGKDFSNPFMVDNLPKIVWFSIHLASHASCYGNEALNVESKCLLVKTIQIMIVG